MTDLPDRLTSRLSEESSLVTASSGGADSALLACVAHLVLGERALAVTAVSASLPREGERAAARHFAQAREIAHIEACTECRQARRGLPVLQDRLW
jgi:uncharacterized protein